MIKYALLAVFCMNSALYGMNIRKDLKKLTYEQLQARIGEIEQQKEDFNRTYNDNECLNNQEVKKKKDAIWSEGLALTFALVSSDTIPRHLIKPHGIDIDCSNNNNDAQKNREKDGRIKVRTADEAFDSDSDKLPESLRRRIDVFNTQSDVITNNNASVSRPGSNQGQLSKQVKSEDPLLAQKQELEKRIQELNARWDSLFTCALGKAGKELEIITGLMDAVEDQRMELQQKLKDLKNKK